MDNQTYVLGALAALVAAFLLYVATANSPEAPVLPTTEAPAVEESTETPDKDTNTIIRENLGAH